jgi:hypothetical protein
MGGGILKNCHLRHSFCSRERRVFFSFGKFFSCIHKAWLLEYILITFEGGIVMMIDYSVKGYFVTLSKNHHTRSVREDSHATRT